MAVLTSAPSSASPAPLPGPVLPYALGILTGACLAVLIARWTLRRYLRRISAAERRARTAERMAEIGAMTSGLAHEIKNPLSTIGLNAQLLAEGIEDLSIEPDERGRLSRRAASLRREVDRLRGILSDFLEYAGEIRLDRRRADLNAVVDELVDFFLPQAEKMGVRLRADLAPGPLMAVLDAQAVKQAALNLMLNAVQAMSPAPAAPGASDGARPKPAGELIIRTTRQAEADRRPLVVLHVIDTGPGMDEATSAKIFEPYFTTKAGGSGLGLPTARRLVEAHGGRIGVHTEPGRGTDFILAFPAEAPPGRT